MPRQKAAVRHGWIMALGIGLAVGMLLWLTLLLVPHLMLTRLMGVSRGVRVGMATVWIGATTVAFILLGARYGRRPGGES